MNVRLGRAYTSEHSLGKAQQNQNPHMRGCTTSLTSTSSYVSLIPIQRQGNMTGSGGSVSVSSSVMMIYLEAKNRSGSRNQSSPPLSHKAWCSRLPEPWELNLWNGHICLMIFAKSTFFLLPAPGGPHHLAELCALCHHGKPHLRYIIHV